MAGGFWCRWTRVLWWRLSRKPSSPIARRPAGRTSCIDSFHGTTLKGHVDSLRAPPRTGIRALPPDQNAPAIFTKIVAACSGQDRARRPRILTGLLPACMSAGDRSTPRRPWSRARGASQHLPSPPPRCARTEACRSAMHYQATPDKLHYFLLSKPAPNASPPFKKEETIR